MCVGVSEMLSMCVGDLCMWSQHEMQACEIKKCLSWGVFLQN